MRHCIMLHLVILSCTIAERLRVLEEENKNFNSTLQSFLDDYNNLRQSFVSRSSVCYPLTMPANIANDNVILRTTLVHHYIDNHHSNGLNSNRRNHPLSPNTSSLLIPLLSSWITTSLLTPEAHHPLKSLLPQPLSQPLLISQSSNRILLTPQILRRALPRSQPGKTAQTTSKVLKSV